MNRFSWTSTAALVLTLAASGCGPGGPRLYKAGGTVTDNKAPVVGAHVTFAYADGNFANGFTDSAGKFQLAYMNRPGGAPVGKCTVTISKREGLTPDIAAPAILDVTPKSEAEQKEKMAAQQKQMEEFTKRQAELDGSGGKAAGFEKTGLVLEIKPNESENDFVIDLGDPQFSQRK